MEKIKKIIGLTSLVLLYGFYPEEKRTSNDFIYDTWVQLTIENGDTCIYEPCDARNRYIMYTKDSIIDFTGTEEIRHKIRSSFSKGKETIVVLEAKGFYATDTISYESFLLGSSTLAKSLPFMLVSYVEFCF